jgi:hypothetical protein
MIKYLLKKLRGFLFVFLVFLLLATFTPNLVDASTTQKTYTLYWQNGQSQEGSIIQGYNFQFIWLDITILSDSDFAPNSNITIYGQGSMSGSLLNSSLISGIVSFDGAMPYPPMEGSHLGFNTLSIREVTPNDKPFTAPIGTDDSVHIIADPVSVTWASGGTHYPTLDFEYWDGGSINKQFLDAPIVIKSDQPNITVIIPTAEPEPRTTFGVIDPQNWFGTALFSLFPILVFGFYLTIKSRNKENDEIINFISVDFFLQFFVMGIGEAVFIANFPYNSPLALPQLIIVTSVSFTGVWILYKKFGIKLVLSSTRQGHAEHTKSKPHQETNKPPKTYKNQGKGKGNRNKGSNQRN